MSVIGRDELDAVAMAHRAYCQSVPGMPWTRLADGEYKAIIRAAQPQGAVDDLNEALALLRVAQPAADRRYKAAWREQTAALLARHPLGGQ